MCPRKREAAVIESRRTGERSIAYVGRALEVNWLWVFIRKAMQVQFERIAGELLDSNSSSIANGHFGDLAET